MIVFLIVMIKFKDAFSVEYFYLEIKKIKNTLNSFTQRITKLVSVMNSVFTFTFIGNKWTNIQFGAGVNVQPDTCRNIVLTWVSLSSHPTADIRLKKYVRFAARDI